MEVRSSILNPQLAVQKRNVTDCRVRHLITLVTNVLYLLPILFLYLFLFLYLSPLLFFLMLCSSSSVEIGSVNNS